MKKTNLETRKLPLDIKTVRQLQPSDLAAVVGGSLAISVGCHYRISVGVCE